MQIKKEDLKPGMLVRDTPENTCLTTVMQFVGEENGEYLFLYASGNTFYGDDIDEYIIFSKYPTIYENI